MAVELHATMDRLKLAVVDRNMPEVVKIVNEFNLADVAFMIACQVGNDDVFELYSDKISIYAVSTAAENGRVKYLERMVKTYENVSHAFIGACKMGHLNIVEMYYKKVDRYTYNKGVDVAIFNDRINVLKLLEKEKNIRWSLRHVRTTRMVDYVMGKGANDYHAIMGEPEHVIKRVEKIAGVRLKRL